MIKRLSLLVGFLLGFIFLMQAQAVHACTPTVTPMEGTEIPSYTLEDRINAADIVFVGTVTGGETRYGSTLTTANIDVERYLKGDGAARVQLSGFGDSAECRAGVRIEERYIFIAIEGADGTLYGSYFHGYSPLVSATDENIEQIIAITNHDVAPAPLPIGEQVQEMVNDESFWTTVMLVVPVIIGIAMGFVMFMLKRGGRKKKVKRL